MGMDTGGSYPTAALDQAGEDLMSDARSGNERLQRKQAKLDKRYDQQLQGYLNTYKKALQKDHRVSKEASGYLTGYLEEMVGLARQGKDRAQGFLQSQGASLQQLERAELGVLQNHFNLIRGQGDAQLENQLAQGHLKERYLTEFAEKNLARQSAIYDDIQSTQMTMQQQGRGFLAKNTFANQDRQRVSSAKASQGFLNSQVSRQSAQTGTERRYAR